MTELKEKAKEFLSSLEGYHQILKELHWSSDNHSQHILLNDIDGSVLDFEDTIAECVMGITDSKFGVGDLKTMLPGEKEIKGILKELLNDIFELKTFCNGKQKYCGLENILDDFVKQVNKWNYLRTFK